MLPRTFQSAQRRAAQDPKVAEHRHSYPPNGGGHSKQQAAESVRPPRPSRAGRPSRNRRSALLAFALLTWGAASLNVNGTDVDTRRLPAPSSLQVDYKRDVRPIFEAACFQCHAGERPKSRYRLTDRDSAVQGGALGVAIVPGDSARSPLVHYVARLVEDLEMPPPGKGEPLTREQVATLRAWIDQGASYPETAARPTAAPRLLSVTPAFGWVSVDGNAARFREQHWLPDEASGGFQSIEWHESVGRHGRFTTESRLVFGADDYELKLRYDQRDLGFLRGGFSQYRRWFDDTGGYYAPFHTPAFALGRDLYLDTGRAWFEAGLTRPNLPRLTVGYEYQFREGERSTLQWGAVLDPANAEARAIYPAAKSVDEQVHIVRLDVQHTLWGVGILDSFRGEFTDLQSSRSNVESYTLGNTTPDFATRYHERFHSFEGANTLRLEKPIKDWLLVSAGYLYSSLDGDAGFSSEGFIPGDPSQGPFVGSVANEIVLRREAHVFNANTQLGPWQTLTLSAGVQADWSRQEGFGNATLNGLPSTLDANLDRFALTEHLGLRFTRIPFTILHAEARLQQDDYGQYEQSGLDDGFGDANDFLRNTDASAELCDLRAGATLSPWTYLAFDAGFRWRSTDTAYDVNQDEDLSPASGNGYPALIRARDVASDEANARAVWHTARWLKTSLKYQFVHSTIDTRTTSVLDPNTSALAPGGWLQSGEHTAHVYSLNATLTPWRRLLLNTTASISDAETTTGLDTAAVEPYAGQIYTVLTSLTYALDTRTDLTANYAFSKAHYAQDNAADGLPLGLLYDRHSVVAGVKRQFKHGLTASLQYGLFLYHEPTSGGAADYTAHGVSAWISKRFQ